jgi:hypothetical protein
MKFCHLQVNRTEDNHVKCSNPGSERQKSYVFSHMWKIDPKDNLIPKYKHALMDMYICRTCFLIGLCEDTSVRRERKRE